MTNAAFAIDTLRLAVLRELSSICGQEGVAYSRMISARLGIAPEMLAALLKEMKQDGLVVYVRGLISEDGDPQGSGYTLTSAGHTELVARAGEEAGRAQSDMEHARVIRRMALGGDGYFDQADISRLHRVADHLEARGAVHEKMREALHDAIRRPMGTVPESAEGFVSVAELDEAEIRRPTMPGERMVKAESAHLF